MRGKTIRQFLIDGQADGRWVSELSNWTGKAYKIPRTYINQCTDRDDLSNTGVYFLFGRNDETDEEQVYIGEAENIFNRLKQHLSEKDFWTECIVFISLLKTKNIFSRKNENKSDGTVNGIESGTVNISLNKNEQAVYGLLGKNHYYTRQELADATSKSLRTIQRTLDSLRKKDLIERIGSDKSGYWEVKNLD